jgi:nicotinamide phosphoribosyltransferase
MNDLLQNFIIDTDSYKTSHFLQYPPGTEHVSSYIEPRAGDGWQDVVFFGLQMFVEKYLMRPISSRDIIEAHDFWRDHGVPFNLEGWKYIYQVHGGYLPLQITALPEGMVVPRGTPLVQVMNTDPNVPWLTSYYETALLRAVWYPTTVATRSREIKKNIAAELEWTSDDPAGQLPFKLHDFGGRGCTSFEQAGLGGAAHLVNFMGTDTAPGAAYARKFYGEHMAGYSIPAAEHSTITSWGKSRELDAYANMLEQFPTGLVAVVSDSYDLYNAVDKLWGVELRDKVLKRDGVTVIRPDSGDPMQMVSFTLNSLGRTFGYTTNSKGYKVLNNKIRIIQGDGVNDAAIPAILRGLREQGWSADNIAFGMGAGLLQNCTRDTLRFAMKASAIRVDGDWHEVFKDPITDPGKASKRGIQHVCVKEGELSINSTPGPETVWYDMLQPAYTKASHNAEPDIRKDKFEYIRERAKI